MRWQHMKALVLCGPSFALLAFMGAANAQQDWGWGWLDVATQEKEWTKAHPKEGIPQPMRRPKEAGLRGAEVPAHYRGIWCSVPGNSTSYYRCREATGEDSIYIRRDLIYISEEGGCRVTAVTPTAKGHRLRVYCPDVLPKPPEYIDLWLDARGRLH
jgi:hypothetical protein